jgi:hypothetical protein
MEHRDRLISVRKLAALDIVSHGLMRILVEFAVGLLLAGSLGLLFLSRGLAPGPSHSLVIIFWGFVLFGIGLNYLPLLIYAITISRLRSAQEEVASELADPDAYRRMYTLQSAIFILVPFALFILAIVQEARWSRS